MRSNTDACPGAAAGHPHGQSAGGRPFAHEYRLVTCDGNEIWVWEQGRSVDHAEGTVLEGIIKERQNTMQAASGKDSTATSAPWTTALALGVRICRLLQLDQGSETLYTSYLLQRNVTQEMPAWMTTAVYPSVFRRP